MKNKLKRNHWRFKFRITLLNEQTLHEVGRMRLSLLHSIMLLLSIITLLIFSGALLVAFSPLKNYLPGYLNVNARKQIIENQIKLDSLEQIVGKQHLYVNAVQKIISGNISVDSINTLDSLVLEHFDSLGNFTSKRQDLTRKIKYDSLPSIDENEMIFRRKMDSVYGVSQNRFGHIKEK